MHVDELLFDERQRAEYNVLSLTTNILQIFERGEVAMRLPDEVGKKERQGNREGDPDPRPGILAAIMREKEGYGDGKAEEQGGMLVLETQARQHAEPDPQPRITG